MIKYYIEYNTIMEIKEFETDNYAEIIPLDKGKYNKVCLDAIGRTYFIIDRLYDTIEECVKELWYYSKQVKFPNGEIKYIN